MFGVRRYVYFEVLIVNIRYKKRYLVLSIFVLEIVFKKNYIGVVFIIFITFLFGVVYGVF